MGLRNAVISGLRAWHYHRQLKRLIRAGIVSELPQRPRVEPKRALSTEIFEGYEQPEVRGKRHTIERNDDHLGRA